MNISLEGIDSSGYVFYPLANLTDVVIGNRDLPETIEVGRRDGAGEWWEGSEDQHL